MQDPSLSRSGERAGERGMYEMRQFEHAPLPTLSPEGERAF